MPLARATDRKPLRIALWVAQTALVLAFECLGVLKSCMPAAELQGELHLLTHTPHSIVQLVGGIEAAGAVLLLLPSTLRLLPALTPIAAAGLFASALLSAIIPGTGAALGVPLPNLLLAGLAGFVAWGRAHRAPIEACHLEKGSLAVDEELDEVQPRRLRPVQRPTQPWANA